MALPVREAVVREWMGIQQFPAATQASLVALLNRLRGENLEEMTILLLGKSGMGKSSTVNSLFGERVVSANAFQAETQMPVQVSRSRGGFTIHMIDTPGLEEAGSLNDLNLDRIRKFCLDKTINVMLYVDRLDAYRVDSLDRQIMKGIARAFGPQIWKIGAVVLTHAHLPAPPDGSTYEEFVAQRSQALLTAVRQEGHLRKGHQVSVLLMENSSRVGTNDSGEKVLPNGEVFLVRLVEELVNVSTGGEQPVRVTQELINGRDANKRGKIWIPVLALIQYFLIVRPLQKAIQRDVDLEKDTRQDWELRAEDYVRRGGRDVSRQRQAAFKGRDRSTSFLDDDDDDY